MTKNGILREISRLHGLSSDELKARWRELSGTEPPTSNRAALIRRVAYRIQELAYGGVSECTRARLRAHAEKEGITAEGANGRHVRRRRQKNGVPVAGTRLVREWHGERHEVTVVQGGFEYEGCHYRSLTAIAQVITGTHWNGPAFFGLRKPEKERQP